MEGMYEDMWTPYKHLYRVIEKSLESSSGNRIVELDIFLKKYKQNFSTLLKNPPKNEQSRNQLLNGMTEGVSIPGHSRPMLLSKDLVDESIIISDMFDLDEYLSMELLCTAQRQMSRHPGLPRGLVAILLYYDGRKAIAYSLRDLFQATSGMSWMTEVPKEVTQIITAFTQSLVEDYNILNRIIDLLETLDITKESVLLTKNRAFGPKKHQNQVLDLFEEIRVALATAFFNWSAQRGLSKNIVARLIQYFAKYKTAESTGNMDDVTLIMLMAFLYACDTSLLLRQEDTTTIVQNLPVLNETGFAQKVYEVIVSNQDWDWGCNTRLYNFIKFSYGLTLASLRQAPQNIQNSVSRIIDRDEQLIDESISLKIFDFIYYYVLEKDIIFKTEFFYRRIHQMFTDFIDFMHSKVTELRGRADETARTVMSFSKEGLDPPANLDHNFEMLMLCIGKFYKKNRCGLSLCSDYWGPLDMSSTNSKTTSRSVSLFKFIRLAGELLPPTLFVSYLKMIAGLSSCERSARNTFNLLKQVIGLSGSATLSWEHFFGSLTRYYSNLRREQCPGSDTIYKNRMLNRSINPQEIEGLRAVLGVIQAVANYDEVARVAICEHPNWAPIHVLLGLLSCSVPLTLKADIVKTLTALAKSKDTAIQLWNNLEASQIFYSLSTTNMCNLEIEIDQNECRLESFPLSQSVLEMLYTLVTTIIPKNLGVGPRKPGFDPYLTFIVNGIFLKFYNRNYRNPAEKWEVGEKCLKLLNYLLKIYEVNPQDFNENMDQSPPPGFHIMLQLHTKSDLLRLILLIIDEAIIKLDEYSKFFGKESLEECAFHCLNILEIGLSKQDVFFDAHSISNSSCLLSGLNKILLDVNPRSRRPDHILNTTKFITYGSWLPRHALVSVKILNFASRLPNINSQILGMLTQNEHTQIEIRHGFVECFEGDIQIPINNTENDLSDNNRIELEIKDAIIGLMQNCLTQPSPNITHFLLGFDVTKDNHWTQVQKSNSSSNCTRSLIALLDNHLEDMKTNNTYDVPTERIIEKGYSLLYSLCENQRTSDTILRYLRNCNDFLCRHISALPFKNSNQSHVLSQMSYLLKCTAIELKLTAHNSQISRFQHLCELLVGFSVKPAHENAPLELNHYFCPSNETRTTFNNKPGDTSSHMLLCHILDCIEFEMKSQSYPKWNFFENSLTEQILHDCETKTENGPKLINIKKLNDVLNDELRTVQSSIASGQRQLILQEIESVLLLALQLNEEKNKNFATIKLMEAWGQVTEMLFTSAPELAIPIVTKQELILEILQKILGKIVPVQAIFELAILSSGTVLLLLVNLRYCHAQNTFENINVSRHEDRNNTSHMEIEKNSSNLTSAKSNALSLTFILRKIIEWIIISEVSSQKLRINLYAALLNCMCIVKGKNSVDYDDKKEEYFVSRLDKSIAKDNITGSDNNQIRLAVEVFKSFGEKLLDIICHDCIAGHDICKMSALSCIDTLLDLDSLTSSIHFVANRGYLSHIIDSLYKSDEGLCRVLKSSPDNMRALYVYESKMAMLLRVASNHVGAELLLGDKILGVLSGMKVFDMHPDIEINNITRKCQMEEFIPPADARYRQILFPALNLCDCIISTLGSENHSVISQVAHFLLSHCDMIETILRSGTPFMDLGLLKELTEITGLIARTANQELFALADANQDVGVNLYRLQRLMLSLFSRFAINETTLKEMFKIENLFYQPTEQNKSLHVRYFLEIASNLSLYCRNAISNHSVDHRSTGILFSPFVSEPIQRIDQRNNSIKITQNLGDILNQLKGSVEYYNSQKSVMDNLLRQRSSLPNLSIDTKARATFLELTDSLNIKQNELSLCSFITEQCLYLLWSHLDFYMLRAASNNSKIMFSGMSSSMALPTNAGNAWLMSTEDINTLKKNLISVFNETFSKQLLLTVESHVSSDKGYAEALLRRIKSLIQFAATN